MHQARVVLFGAGQTHLTLLRRRFAGALASLGRVILIDRDCDAYYSAAVPGKIAGNLPSHLSCFNLQELCSARGITFVEGTVKSLYPAERKLVLTSGDEVEFDFLSINAGLTQKRLNEFHSNPLNPLNPKPYAQFLRSLPSKPQALKVYGAGAAGVEIAFALRKRLPNVSIDLLHHADLPLSERSPHSLRERILSALGRRQIAFSGKPSSPGSDNHQSGALAINCTGGEPSLLFTDSGLRTNNSGAISVTEELQSESHQHVFACGDIVHNKDWDYSPCGVHAVRQAPILLQNLRASLDGRSLRRAYKPPKKVLNILDDSHGRAFAIWGSRWQYSRAMLLLKRQIDQAYIKGFLS